MTLGPLNQLIPNLNVEYLVLKVLAKDMEEEDDGKRVIGGGRKRWILK